MEKRGDLRDRMSAVIKEYLRLDTELREVERTHFRVCIFGSARIQPEDEIYKAVQDVARKLAMLGIDVVTGGGPGLMEAANRAVREAHVKRVRSYGLPLDIPGIKEVANPHLDIKSMHQRFSSRLDEFMRLADAVVIAPGGIGTLLELFYVWQLLQLSMVDPCPVILLGREYWKGLMDWMEAQVLGHHLINPIDLDSIKIVETPDEAIALIQPVFETYKEKRREARKARKELAQNAETVIGKAPDELRALERDSLTVPAGNGNSAISHSADPPAIVTPVDAASALVGKIAPPRTRTLRRRRK